MTNVNISRIRLHGDETPVNKKICFDQNQLNTVLKVSCKFRWGISFKFFSFCSLTLNDIANLNRNLTNFYLDLDLTLPITKSNCNIN